MMDILDIDEALKDDSFIFLEDKTHDDVSNILQQWKSNNCMQQQQQQQNQQQQQLQQQQQSQEQAYKLNSRTFTRPKRKLAQNLESQFTNSAQYAAQNGGTVPMLNMEIGGLVTTMQKSFLQDTSPPSSICSSMDVSIDRMNNSLITSADFSSLNFLQSTNALDFNDVQGVFNFGQKSADIGGYTLSDMIRDRKALDALTMSGDGTLIKDCNIAQIDDISLTLSKTASGCSTMDNSTESVEGVGGDVGAGDSNSGNVGINNRTIEIPQQNRTFEQPAVAPIARQPLLQRTMLLSNEMIGDTTFNLIENSLCINEPPTTLNVTLDLQPSVITMANETFKKPPPTNVASSNSHNETYDCNDETPRCETPENLPKKCPKFCESTPQTSSVRYNKQHFTPSIKIVEDVNISPIVAPTQSSLHNATRVLNATFEPQLPPSIEAAVNSATFSESNEQPAQEQNVGKLNSATFSEHNVTVNIDAVVNADVDADVDVAVVDADVVTSPQLNSQTFNGDLPNFESLELLENTEQPVNGTFCRSRSRTNFSAAGNAMQNVMELAQAEAELLASNEEEDEAEFEHMLDALGRVELNAEQLKMKKSLDSIKKRFTYGQQAPAAAAPTTQAETNALKATNNLTQPLENERQELLLGDDWDLRTACDAAMELRGNEIKKLRDSMRESRELKASLHRSARETLSESRDSANMLGTSFTTSTGNSGGSGAERLLSRRSRLYDGINLSTLSNETFCEATTDAADAAAAPKTEAAGVESQQRIAEKRERDRERFKTIKIVKQRGTTGGDEDDGGQRLNVPCIDDDNVEAVVNEQHAEVAEAAEEEEQQLPPPPTSHLRPTNTNYLTYKKPKDKMPRRNLPEVLAPPPTTVAAAVEEAPVVDISNTKSRLEPRSLSRPRYISGLTKFSAVSKATSAGDLEQTTANCARQQQLNLTLNSGVPTTGGYKGGSANFNRTQPPLGNGNGVKELKSPMGIKSKSFHNLSSNFGGGIGLSLAKPTSGYAVKKSSNTSGILTEKQAKANPIRTTNSGVNNMQRAAHTESQKPDDSLFKMPKLVSGIRAPGAAASGLKRAGLVRPSSGYYSLSVAPAAVPAAKNVPHNVADHDFETGRHSPTDSMSSASSRSSVQSIGYKHPAPTVPAKDCAPPPPTAAHAPLSTLTKITTGSTGIPKPSGLRPPTTQIKRSGLPRPASIVRR